MSIESTLISEHGKWWNVMLKSTAILPPRDTSTSRVWSVLMLEYRRASVTTSTRMHKATDRVVAPPLAERARASSATLGKTSRLRKREAALVGRSVSGWDCDILKGAFGRETFKPNAAIAIARAYFFKAAAFAAVLGAGSTTKFNLWGQCHHPRIRGHMSKIPTL